MNRFLLALLFTALAALPVQATEAAWAKLMNGGYTVLLRHSVAPGHGDPPGFQLGDCSTQRNLSARGRQQARNIGARVAARAVAIDAVYSSQWCRCLDTARHAFDRMPAQEFPALNAFIGERDTEAEQTAEVIEAIRAFRGSGNQVFITHQANIKAITGITARSGVAIIVEPQRDGDGVRVAGRIILD